MQDSHDDVNFTPPSLSRIRARTLISCPVDRTKAENVYDHWGQSLDAYEQSVQVSAFTSKFDAYLAGSYTFTADEEAGYKLFNGKGNCNSCHLDGRSTAPTPPPPEDSSQR